MGWGDGDGEWWRLFDELSCELWHFGAWREEWGDLTGMCENNPKPQGKRLATSMEHLSRNGGRKMLKTQHVPSWSLGQGAVGVTCDAIVPTETSFRSAGRWNVRHARHPIALLASAGYTKTKHFNNKRTLPRDTPMTFCAACRSNDQSNQRICSFPNQMVILPKQWLIWLISD